MTCCALLYSTPAPWFHFGRSTAPSRYGVPDVVYCTMLGLLTWLFFLLAAAVVVVIAANAVQRDHRLRRGEG